MPNALYTHLQSVAHRLIGKYGQQGTVTRFSAPDPVEGGEPVPIDYPATLVPMAYQAHEINGTVILAGDVQIYISSVGLAIVPSPGDTVTANGKTFRIINGDPNRYDGVTDVVHIVQGRLAG
ncbi:hypothetical protein [Rhizobium sp. LC145]|uniref:hypothetical protein n=1 Tax=Rhizobium sp. LC145 TaxID=1120688 RepID=UPI000629FBCE|nr:hypothetical protein [Rhizobium sp. LC145]KKX25299.1 hypothetical protein YH62_25455 [Rhizobium sp. LC145]TKT45320.1 hypothetical protein FDR95_25615 [Rhizobiaceae bacterium LC148]